MTDQAEHGKAPVPRVDEPPPRPRWLKLLILGMVVAVLLFLAIHLLTGGGRGPGQHGPGMNHGQSFGPSVIGKSTSAARGPA